MKLNLDKRLFNKLFWDILKSNKYKKLVIYGGSGASKSYSICQHEIYQCLIQPGLRSLFLCKTLPQIKISTQPLLEEILKKWELFDKVIINKSELTYTFPNGSVIKLSDLYDSERKKGLKAGRVWLEEATEADRNECLELIRRLRGIELKDPQIIFSFNPIDIQHWIKETLVDQEGIDRQIKCIRVTYKDNKFLSQDDIDELERLKVIDYDQYRIYCLGEFGHIKTGGEIYTNFKPAYHVSDDVEYNPDAVIQLTFDENTSPWLTCVISQLKDKNINIIDEVCIKQANLEIVLEEIERRYANHKAGIMILGDASSMKKNVFGDSFYTIIKNRLQKFNPDLRVSSINQAVFTRTNFINTEVFLKEKIQIRIHSRCVQTIRDISNVKRSPDGSKEKKMVTKDNMRYQEFGHNSDCLEYLITTLFLSDYHEYQTGGQFRMIQKMRPNTGYRY